jgi:hypothetical protein
MYMMYQSHCYTVYNMCQKCMFVFLVTLVKSTYTVYACPQVTCQLTVNSLVGRQYSVMYYGGLMVKPSTGDVTHLPGYVWTIVLELDIIPSNCI